MAVEVTEKGVQLLNDVAAGCLNEAIRQLAGRAARLEHRQASIRHP